MKKGVVETGTVISLSGNLAHVKMDTAGPCHKCGLGEMGLCKPGGSGMRLTVDNRAGALVGDMVTIGIDKATSRRGYWLAYVLPVAMLIAGTAMGHILSSYSGLGKLSGAFDAAFGLAAFGITMWLSVRRLKLLDSNSKLHVKRILSVGTSADAWQESAMAEGHDYLNRFAKYNA